MKRFLAIAITMAATLNLQAKDMKTEPDGSSRCSARTLNGAYGFTFSGTAPFGAFNSIGVQRFDGSGHFTETETNSIGGQIIQNGGFSGTYTVNPDCSGSLVGQANGFTVTADFVIANGGTVIYALLTEPGANVAGVFTKQ